MVGLGLSIYSHVFAAHTSICVGNLRLPPHEVGAIVDRGKDFPEDIQKSLETYGSDMWLFRDDPDRVTTRAANIYRGEFRG